MCTVSMVSLFLLFQVCGLYSAHVVTLTQQCCVCGMLTDGLATWPFSYASSHEAHPALSVKPGQHAMEVTHAPVCVLFNFIVLATLAVLFLLVAADDSNTSDAAHIHDPLADGTKTVAGAPGYHDIAPTRTTPVERPEAGGVLVPPAATAAFHDEGSIDLDAYPQKMLVVKQITHSRRPTQLG